MNVPVFYLRAGVNKWTLQALNGLFGLYICSGNLWRLFSVPVLKNNILVSEFFLYAVCFFYFVLKGRFSLRDIKILAVSAVILCSSLYGAFLHGFDLESTFYAIRLMFLILCGVQIGEAFFAQYGSSIQEFYQSISFYYTIQLFLGFFIYVVFWDSKMLWTFLAQLGIVFQGDPHEGRFISVYFDPNYYAAIAVIPLIAMYRLAFLQPTPWQFTRLGLLFLSILFTLSRSGIATLLIFLFCLLVHWIFMHRKRWMRSRVWMNAGILLLIVGCFSFHSVWQFLLRLSTTAEDFSALSRWESFRYGLTLVSEYPSLGIGYNYLAQFVKGLFNGSSIDSSVLATIINFGSVMAVLFLSVFVLWLYRFKKMCDSVREENNELYISGNLYSVYLVIVVVFTSLFNNILYYQFWLIPMVATLTYLSLWVNRSVFTAAVPSSPTVRRWS